MDRRMFLADGLAASVVVGSGCKATAQSNSLTATKARLLEDRVVKPNRSYSYKKRRDPTGTAPNRRIERFEIRGGDCSNQGDCTPRPLNGRLVTRARVERVLLTDLRDGDQGLFSYSLYFPSDEYNFIDTVGSTMGQMLSRFSRDPNSDSLPIFSFDTDVGRPRIYLAIGEAPLRTTNRSNSRDFTVGNYRKDGFLRDSWIDVKVRFSLSSRADGFLTAYINDRPTGRFIGRTIVPNGYLEIRYGIYQTGTNQFPGGANALPPQVAYFSNVKVLRYS